MKKILFPMLVGMMTVFFGCNQKEVEREASGVQVDDRTVRMPPPMRERIASEPADEAPEGTDSSAAGSEDELSCDPNSSDEMQCGLIPVSGCKGCANGEAHRVVNKATAERVMGPQAETCMKEMKAFKGPKGNQRDPSCSQFNWAKCSPQGQCVGIMLSEEELKSRMQKMAPKGQGQRPPQGR